MGTTLYNDGAAHSVLLSLSCLILVAFFFDRHDGHLATEIRSFSETAAVALPPLSVVPDYRCT